MPLVEPCSTGGSDRFFPGIEDWVVALVKWRVIHTRFPDVRVNLTLLVSHRSVIDAHVAFLGDIKYLGVDYSPVRTALGRTIGEVGIASVSPDPTDPGATGVLYMAFVRRNVTVILSCPGGGPYEQRARGIDVNGMMIGLAAAIDGDLAQASTVASMAESQLRPEIRDFKIPGEAAGNVTTARSPGESRAEGLLVDVRDPSGLEFEEHLFVVQQPAGDDVSGPWILPRYEATGQDTARITWGYDPGSRPGAQTLRLCAVNARGLMSVKDIAVDVRPQEPPQPPGDQSAGK